MYSHNRTDAGGDRQHHGEQCKYQRFIVDAERFAGSTSPLPSNWSDFARTGEIVDDGWRDNSDVECRPALDTLLQAAGSVVVDDSLVAGLLFEVRHQRQHHLFEGSGREHLDLGGRDDAGKAQRGR
jgi:hypothetical protein